MRGVHVGECDKRPGAGCEVSAVALNPMFGLHVRLMGAWRSQAIILLVLLGGIGALASATYRMADPADRAQVSTGWLTVVLIAQAAFALLIAPGAIRRAVQRDFDTGMMESHRLSPMSGFKIVLGYLTGPTAQAMLLFATNLLVGTYFAAQRALDYGAPLSLATLGPTWLLQLGLLLLAFMLASLVLLTALVSAGKTNIIGLVVLMATVVGWWAWAFVPGVALVFGVLTVIEVLGVFAMQRAPTPGTVSSLTVLMAALAQVAFGITFVVAACRRVRAPERAMFTLPLAIVLLTIWGAALVLGVRYMPAVHPWIPRFDLLATAQIICSTVAFMLVALFAVVAAANDAFRSDRAAAFGERAVDALPRAARATPLLLAGMTLAAAVLMYGQLREGVRPPGLAIAFSEPLTLLALGLAPLLSFWIDYCLIYATIARGGKVFRSLIVWSLGLKIMPLAIDMALTWVREAGEIERVPFTEGVFSGLSPYGTLALCCLEGGRPWPGLIVQVGLAVGATYLALRARDHAVRPTRGVAAATPP